VNPGALAASELSEATCRCLWALEESPT